MSRVVLILPTATYRAADFLAAADELDSEVVVASEEPQTLAEELGTDFVLIDLHRPEWSAEQIERLARRLTVDAVVPVDDGGVLIAALAARRLGLTHNAPDAVARTRNKAMMRRALAEAGTPQPRFAILGPEDDAAAVVRDVGVPGVVKPISLSGSRGVIRIDRPDDAADIAERVRRILAAAGDNPNEPLLIEEFIAGDEIAVEGVLHDGDLTVLAVFDKPDRLAGPYFEETIYVTPSRHHPEVLLEAREIIEKSTAALGLAEGPIHAELRIRNGGLRFLEVAARSIGGLCGRALRFGMMGTSLEALLLRHALGLEIRSLSREGVASGVMMLPIPRAGALEAVHGRSEAVGVPGITSLEITVPLGRQVTPLPEGDRYLGFMFAKGTEPAEVEEALRAAYERLEIVIGDSSPDG